MCHHSDRNRKDARLSWQQLITASGGWRCLYFSYQTAEGTAVAPSIAAAVPVCASFGGVCFHEQTHTRAHVWLSSFSSLSVSASLASHCPSSSVAPSCWKCGRTNKISRWSRELLGWSAPSKQKQACATGVHFYFTTHLSTAAITPTVHHSPRDDYKRLTMRDDCHFDSEPFANFQRVDISRYSV